MSDSKNRWIIPSVKGDEAVKVPCGTCRLCCQGRSLVALVPEMGDDVTQYETVQLGELTVLKFKENGDCHYLGENGCTIHGRAPHMCRIYDCRRQHQQYSKRDRDHAIKIGHLNKEIMRRGATLVHQEEKAKKKSVAAFDAHQTLSKMIKDHS